MSGLIMTKSGSWMRMDELIEDGGVTKEKIPSKPGVYLVRWGNRNKPIPRLLGVDKKKIMYTGHSKDIQRRIGQEFIPPYINNEAGKHSGIFTFYFTGLMEKIELEELEMNWITYETKTMAQTQEFYLLKSYIDRYGELPPINRQTARRKEPKNKPVDSIDESLERLLK